MAKIKSVLILQVDCFHYGQNRLSLKTTTITSKTSFVLIPKQLKLFLLSY